MEFFRQKRNSISWFILSFFLLLILLLPFPVYTAPKKFFQSDPDIDISLGNWDYHIPEQEDVEPLRSGLYLGGYFSSRSRIFSYFFNSQNIYTIYETGISLNRIDDSRDYLLSIPLLIDFAYRLRIVKRLYFQPLLGTGFIIMYSEGNEGGFRLCPLIKTGYEIRYQLWENTYVKFKFDFGVVFDNKVQGGTLSFIRLKFPIPFIP